ncbi:MAG: hypothetical protein Q4G04_06380, partial [bacterium]|nr:hypothetical protein [bacterium]
MKKVLKNLLVATFIFVLAITLTGCGEKKDDYTKLSDEEFLYTIHEWEKEGSPKNVWVFNEDGTGKITTDGEEYFDWSWDVQNGHIVTITKWLYDITDDYPITFDKENVSFTITKDDTTITYVKKSAE